MSEQVTIESKWEYNGEGYEAMMRDLDSVQAKVSETSDVTVASSLRTARGVAHLSTAFMSLDYTIARVSSGQMGAAEAALRLIPTMVSLASAIYTVVGAENARAIAHAIAHSISSLGVLTPLVIAAGAAAAIGVASLISQQTSYNTFNINMRGGAGAGRNLAGELRASGYG